MKKHGFTLLELLIAMGLIVILAAIAAGGLSYAADKSDEAATIATMKEFEMALEKFKSAKGYYPVFKTAVDTDFAVKANRSAWKAFKTGSYLSPEFGDEVKDAYDQFFRYQCPGANNKSSYDLWSIGVDGKDGNEDDICNWKLK